MVPYPSSYNWPNFAMIVPDLRHDMHDGATIPIKVKDGDAWLARQLPPLISYAKKNNGLIILTMDESPDQHIPTILVGPGIPAGIQKSQSINHYNVTRTIIDNFGLPAIGKTAGGPDLNPL